MLTKVCVAAVVAVLAWPAAAQADPPVCPDGDFVTLPNTPVSLDSLRCENVGPSFQIIVDPWPEHGDFDGPPYRFVPDQDYHGYDEFEYTVTDNATHETSEPATVTILIDTPPACSDGSATTPFGQPIRLALPCRDADGDALQLVRNGNVGNGTLADDFMYTPRAGFFGGDGFPFHAKDTFGRESAVQMMWITVASPPVATPLTPPPIAAPAPKDTTAPALTLAAAGKATAAKGVAIKLTTSEAGSATLTLTVDKATARRLKLDKQAKGPVTVGTLSLPKVMPAETTLVVKLTTKARKAFRVARQVKLLLTVVVSDAAGNKATRTLTVTVKR